MTKDFIRNYILNSIEVKKKVFSDNIIIDKIYEISETIVKYVNRGSKVFFAGNGGSYSDAQHVVAEFIGRFKLNREPIPALLLGNNPSSLTAISNDISFSKIFVRELSSLSSKNDIFIALSTSGESQNIIEAVNFSNLNGLHTFALTGDFDSTLSKLCNTIKVPSVETEKIQECHIMLLHIIAMIVEKKIFSNE